jgi:hypothetical protein
MDARVMSFERVMILLLTRLPLKRRSCLQTWSSKGAIFPLMFLQRMHSTCSCARHDLQMGHNPSISPPVGSVGRTWRLGHDLQGAMFPLRRHQQHDQVMIFKGVTIPLMEKYPETR